MSFYVYFYKVRNAPVLQTLQTFVVPHGGDNCLECCLPLTVMVDLYAHTVLCRGTDVRVDGLCTSLQVVGSTPPLRPRVGFPMSIRFSHCGLPLFYRTSFCTCHIKVTTLNLCVSVRYVANMCNKYVCNEYTFLHLFFQTCALSSVTYRNHPFLPHHPR